MDWAPARKEQSIFANKITDAIKNAKFFCCENKGLAVQLSGAGTKF